MIAGAVKPDDRIDFHRVIQRLSQALGNKRGQRTEGCEASQLGYLASHVAEGKVEQIGALCAFSPPFVPLKRGRKTPELGR